MQYIKLNNTITEPHVMLWDANEEANYIKKNDSGLPIPNKHKVISNL